ncbi:MAG: hypothetical protein QHJ73_13400, partial [Armatimonadota bacterium]|nr:hypothetical protein [Armatimonadota bacterium]
MRVAALSDRAVFVGAACVSLFASLLTAVATARAAAGDRFAFPWVFLVVPEVPWVCVGLVLLTSLVVLRRAGAGDGGEEEKGVAAGGEGHPWAAGVAIYLVSLFLFWTFRDHCRCGDFGLVLYHVEMGTL